MLCLGIHINMEKTSGGTMLETTNERIKCNECEYEAIRRIWMGYDLKKELCPKCYATGTLKIISTPSKKLKEAYLDTQELLK